MYQMSKRVTISTKVVIDLLLANNFEIIDNVLDITIVDKETNESHSIKRKDIINILEDNSIIYQLYNNQEIESTINTPSESYNLELIKQQLDAKYSLIQKLILYRGVAMCIKHLNRVYRVVECHILEHHNINPINLKIEN